VKKGDRGGETLRDRQIGRTLGRVRGEDTEREIPRKETHWYGGEMEGENRRRDIVRKYKG
jgi:hypothetical protein